MLAYPLAALPGSLTYRFERLQDPAEDTVSHRAEGFFGFAIIRYDGQGGWRVVSITLHDPRFGQSDFRVPRRTQLFERVGRTLRAMHGENIVQRIADVLGLSN